MSVTFGKLNASRYARANRGQVFRPTICGSEHAADVVSEQRPWQVSCFTFKSPHPQRRAPSTASDRLRAQVEGDAGRCEPLVNCRFEGVGVLLHAMDSINVTPKSATALASPKLVKTAKSFTPYSSVPAAAYGCGKCESVLSKTVDADIHGRAPPGHFPREAENVPSAIPRSSPDHLPETVGQDTDLQDAGERVRKIRH